jgi:hypothetical protein
VPSGETEGGDPAGNQPFVAAKADEDPATIAFERNAIFEPSNENTGSWSARCREPVGSFTGDLFHPDVESPPLRRKHRLNPSEEIVG